MPYSIVIPARYAATRLPGKPLRDVAGKPLVQRVYDCAIRTGATRVIIATDDQRIKEVAEDFGADVCMTSNEHQSGTQRTVEVITRCDIDDNEIIVNLQGDEPLMPAACIDQVAQLLEEHADAQMATLATPIVGTDAVFEPNIVKVVLNARNRALYFSRAPIPWQRGYFEHLKVNPKFNNACLRHIGIYAYRAHYLKTYVGLSPSPLETIESLEQLRVLWHGDSIIVGLATEIPGPGVDTEKDIEVVRQIIQETG